MRSVTKGGRRLVRTSNFDIVTKEPRDFWSTSAVF
jgi:hypothetical protein